MLLRKSWCQAWATRLVLVLAIASVAHGAMAQTLRVWTFLNPSAKTAREIVLKKLIDGFEAAHPGVKIVVETQDYRVMTDKFLAATQTGTAPDVVWLYPARVGDAIKLGALANLDDLFIKNWSKAEIADVDGPMWRYDATPTAHYQIMHSRYIIGQYYRIDLFKQAGIDPQSLSTWDKFIAAAQKLTQTDANGNIVRAGFAQVLAGATPNASTVLSVMLDQDGTIFDKNLRAVWATPAGVRAVQMVVDMIRKYKILPPNAISMGDEDVYDAFDSGRAAIARVGNARFTAVVGAVGAGKVGWLPTPSFTEGKYSPSEVGGWSVAVWSGSKQKQLAGDWVEYISNKQADKMWTIDAGQIPIWQSTITDNPTFFADPNNAFIADAAADIREHGWLPPDGAANGWDEGFNAAVQDVITNGTDPKMALEKAQAAYNRVNRR